MQPKGCEWLEKFHDAALEDCELRWLFTMRYIFIHAAFLICVLDMIPRRLGGRNAGYSVMRVE
jgi:hypothetical protein